MKEEKATWTRSNVLELLDDIVEDLFLCDSKDDAYDMLARHRRYVETLGTSIDYEEPLKLNESDSLILVKALADPPEDCSQEMKDAVARYNKSIGK